VVHSFKRLCQALLLSLIVALVPQAALVAAAGPFTVTSTADAGDAFPGNGACATSGGACTLRAALEEANASAGPTTINFNIPTSDGGYNAGLGVWSIRPTSVLPTLSAGGLTINASSQPGGRASGPKIELDGGLITTDRNGFTITSANNVIDGFVINRFLSLSTINKGIGIYINGDNADGTIVRNSWIGTDAAGTSAAANDFAGIYVKGGDNTQILSNVVSGNGGSAGSSSNMILGITVDDSSTATDNTTVAGNLIGTNATGSGAVGGGNPQNGIWIAYHTHNTLVGGSTTAARNVISGHSVTTDPGRSGIRVDGLGQSGNVIRGNYIGTNAAGTGAIANAYGISLRDAVNGTQVIGNLISGNLSHGVNAEQLLRSTSGLVIQDNSIGLSSAGGALGNGGSGVAFYRNGSNAIGVTGSTIQGNTIAANTGDGILIGSAGLAGSLFASNVIVGNYIGTATGGGTTSTALLNGRYGVEVVSGSGIRVGGTVAAERNIIAAGFGFAGVRLSSANVSGASVLGNYIGVASNGSSPLIGTPGSRASFGVLVDTGSTGNTIGDVGGANLIAANDTGVQINASSTNTVRNNLIGISGAGNNQFGVWLLNAGNNTIGGTGANQGNTIAANGRNGIVVNGTSATNTLAGNTVSGSGQDGVLLNGAGASGAVVDGNSIVNSGGDGLRIDAATGVRVTRTTTNGNSGDGIRLVNGGNANRAAPTLSATLTTGGGGQPAVTGTAVGCTSPGCVVEIFSSATRADGEGPRFLASGTADPTTGAFTINIPGCDRFLTATARDPVSNNTSPFSTPMVDTTTGCAEATPLLSPGTPATSAAAPQIVAAGTQVSYQHTLTNNGGLPGTFAISVTPGAQGWPVQLSRTSVTLGAGLSTTIFITVSVPLGARGGPPPEGVTVTASAGALSSSQIDYTQVTQVFGVDISPVSVQFTPSPSAQSLDFVHTIVNTGNGFDTITVSAVNATIPGAPTFSFPSGNQCVGLAAGASCSVTVRVTLPANSNGGTFNVTASGGGGASETVTDVALTQSVIPQVTVFPRRDAFPSDVVTFVHTVTNIGTQAGSFTVTLDEPAPLDGWVYTLSSPTTFSLNPNESTTVTVTATVPGIGSTGAISGTIKTATLQVTASSGAVASAPDSVRVLHKPQFMFGPASITPVSGFPLATVTFTHTLQNTSNGDDRFTIAVAPTSGLENVVVSPSVPISVPAGQSAQVVIQARIKAGTAASTGVEHLTVTASSLGTPAPAPQVQTDDVDVLGATVPQLSVSPLTQSSAPGATVRFTYTLANTGNQTGSFNAPTFGLPNATAGWAAAVVGAPACINGGTLAPNASCTFDVDVTVPAGALQGASLVHATVTSATTPGAPAATAIAQVVVSAVPGVEFDPDQSGTTGPAAPITYQHVITNTGNVTDTFTFTAQVPAGWSAPAPATVTNLAPGQSQAVVVTVTPPQIIAAGASATVVFTARSSVAPNPTDTASDTTTIAAVDGATLTPPDQTTSGSAGQVVFFYPTLQNTGSTAIAYDLSVTTAGWTSIVTPTTTAVLQPGATVAVTVSVQIPLGTPADVDNLATVTVTPQGAPGSVLATGRYTATTAILGSLLTPPVNERTALPGATVVYTHTLRNIGSVADTFTLRTIATNGWQVSVEPASVFLDSGASRVISVTVVVPPGLAAGVQDYSYVEAQALSDPRLSGRGTEITTVQRFAEPLLSPTLARTTTPGATIDFAHRLINNGNALDTFTVEATSEQGWPVTVTVPAGNTVTLQPNGNFPVEVRVQVPTTITPGTFDRITVRVTSQFDSSVSASVTNTIFYPPEPEQLITYKLWLPAIVK
jgi:CSLREA domain-containing protein